MPAEVFPESFAFLSGDQLLTYDEIVRLVAAARTLGLKKVKLTGGEPLLRSLVPQLVSQLKTAWPDLEVGLITNGLRLQPLVQRLYDAGLDGVTISIDALDPERFSRITGNGHHVETILDAIEAAHEVFGRVKLNTVLLKGDNDNEVEPLALRYRRPGFNLRFIEFMDVGTLNRWSRGKVVTGDEVLQRLRALGGLQAVEKAHPGETSERWAWADGQGEVGFINSVSRPFCGNCSRLRVGADGKLYTCLFSSIGTDFRTPLRSGSSVEEVSQRLTALWQGRSDRYSELRTDGHGARVEMFSVGG